jgi:hypothetical protein
MSYKDCVHKTKLFPDLDKIVGISGERRVFFRVVGAQIGSAGADVIEKDRRKVALKRRFNQPPHGLITTEPM